MFLQIGYLYYRDPDELTDRLRDRRLLLPPWRRLWLSPFPPSEDRLRLLLLLLCLRCCFRARRRSSVASSSKLRINGNGTGLTCIKLQNPPRAQFSSSKSRQRACCNQWVDDGMNE